MPRDVSPLPWFHDPDLWQYTVFSGQPDGDSWSPVAASARSARTDDLRTIVDSVNLVGPHIDRPGFADIVKAIGGMDDDVLGQLADFLKEKGWME
jgi:hypothetical protein